MGAGIDLCPTEDLGFWESARLPRLRRPVARATVLGRLSWHCGCPAPRPARRPRRRTARSPWPRAGWMGHLAGQHLDVRSPPRTAIARCGRYSIASRHPATPGRHHGRAAGRRRGLAVPGPRTCRSGDQLEVRGPIGGWFVWRHRADRAGPAGGRWLRHRPADVDHADAPAGIADDQDAAAVLDPLTAVGHLPRRDRRRRGARHRSAPDGAGRRAHRLDAEDLERFALPAGDGDLAIRGPTNFVESAAELFLAAGYQAGRIRTERFGGGGT